MKVDRQIFIKQKLFQFRPHVMKKILLGVTGVRAEMRGGKAAQAWLAGAAAREIKPLQRAFNPDIHGKRGIKSVGEEQNAVGNLPAHAAQFHQLGARLDMGQMADVFQIKFPFGDLPRGGQQVGGAKAHLAGTQFGFGGGGEALWCGEAGSGDAWLPQGGSDALVAQNR